jgi:hypothetical protein
MCFALYLYYAHFVILLACDWNPSNLTSQAPRVDGSTWASQSTFGLCACVPKDIVVVSSSDTNEGLELLMLESERGDSPHPTLNDVLRTSSESSTSSE